MPIRRPSSGRQSRMTGQNRHREGESREAMEEENDRDGAMTE